MGILRLSDRGSAASDWVDCGGPLGRGTVWSATVRLRLDLVSALMCEQGRCFYGRGTKPILEGGMGRNRLRLPARSVLVLSCVAVIALAGCSSGASSAGKDGAPTGPIVLRVATDDESGRPTTAMIEAFAREVQQRSDGALVIEPAYEAAGMAVGSHWDQQVARLVMSGEMELGLIPSRAWDTEGVTSLRALNAPFLIQSDVVVNDVVGGSLAEPLMSGLSAAGVSGLALFPESLRHPFGLSEPLFGPADYAGQSVRAPTSATVSSMFAAWGAQTNDHEIDRNEHAGMESSYDWASNFVATGNVTYFPKVDVLVINNDVLAELSEDQRSLLVEAAEAARDSVIASAQPDAEKAIEFCAAGGSVELAEERTWRPSRMRPRRSTPSCSRTLRPRS